MVRPGECLLVAVSGGVDSVVLLHLLARLRVPFDMTLVAANLDHRLRPGGMEAAALVRGLAASLGVPFVSGALEPGWAAAGERGLQAKARDARYRFLDDAAQRGNAHKIALGHNADDQAETVLMRLFRGAGLRGLSGMAPVREDRYIRPLIDASRRSIAAYAQDCGLTFADDPSNVDRRFLRARVRHDLLPRIEAEVNPRGRRTLAETAGLLRVDADCLDEAAAVAYAGARRETGSGRVTLSVAALQTVHDALKTRALRLACRDAGGDPERLRRHQLLDILRWLDGPGRSRELALPGGLVATLSYGSLTLGRRPVGAPDCVDVTVPVPGVGRIAPLGWTVGSSILDPEEAAARPPVDGSARFDADRLPGALRVRTRRPGDLFRPTGLGGTKKVKDFLMDIKVPRTERDSVPLLVASEQVLWIVPYRLDERFLAGTETDRILEVTFTRLGMNDRSDVAALY